MVIPLPDVRYDETVRRGTAEYYDNWEVPEVFHGVLFFHDKVEHQRWIDGASFRLINHWSKPAPKPNYK